MQFKFKMLKLKKYTVVENPKVLNITFSNFTRESKNVIK